MKIIGVNSTLYSGSNKTLFRGLEGYTIVKQTDYEVDKDYYDRKIPYFPFKDETQQEIENFVKANTYSQKHTAIIDFETGDSVQRTDTYKVEVKDRLPFEKSLWDLYKKNKYKLNKTDKTFIETSLKELNLKQYIRKNPIKYIIAKLAK